MGSLVDCLKQFKIAGLEAKEIQRRAKNYRDEGVKGKEATTQAINDLINEAEGDRASIISQVKEQGKPKVAGLPIKETKLPLEERQRLLKKAGYEKEAFKLGVEEGRVAGTGKGVQQKGLPFAEKDAFKEKLNKQEVLGKEGAKKEKTIRERKASRKLDTELDDIVAATKKLGGLNQSIEHMKGEIKDLSPKEAGKRAHGLVFKEKGKSFDGMVEALKEHGYLEKNEGITDYIAKMKLNLYQNEPKWSNKKDFTFGPEGGGKRFIPESRGIETLGETRKEGREHLVRIKVDDKRLYGEGELTYTGKPSRTKGEIDLIYTDEGKLLVEDGWSRIQDAKNRGEKTIDAWLFYVVDRSPQQLQVHQFGRLYKKYLFGCSKQV